MPYSIPNITNGTTGLEDLLVSTSGQVSALANGILIFIFLTILGSGYYSQERRTGRGNFPMWVAIAGLITTTASFILYLVPGIIGLESIVIGVAITIIGSLWFMLSEDEA